MKVTIKNLKTGISRSITLPISNDELLDITIDVLGRDENGYVIVGQGYCYVDENGQNIESVFDLNNQLTENNCN